MCPNRVKNCFEGLFNMYRTDRRAKCEKEKRNVKRLQRKMETSKAMYWPLKKN